MSSLPEEIYLDILLRLPVKSISVCKCVCKSWFQLISHPDFVKSHLNHTTQRNNLSLLFKCLDDSSWYSISYDSLSNEPDAPDVVELKFPYTTSSELLGSCDGLVYGWNKQKKFFFLWNPATTKYRILPKTTDYLGGLHGLVYQHKNEDYKLVNIEDTLVQVYSLKSNSWKSFQSIGFEFHLENEQEYGSSGLLFNGALHWFGPVISGMPPTMIVSMDVTEETFEKLKLPTALQEVYFMDMEVLERCLCVVAHFEETFEVWVMQDYGFPESWTKLYTIRYVGVFCDTDSSCFLRLMGSLNGEILFKNADNLVFHKPKYGTWRRSNIHGSMVEEAMPYFESLISPKSITAVGKRKRREITGNLKKSTTNTTKKLSIGKKRNRDVAEHSEG